MIKSQSSLIIWAKAFVFGLATAFATASMQSMQKQNDLLMPQELAAFEGLVAIKTAEDVRDRMQLMLAVIKNGKFGSPLGKEIGQCVNDVEELYDDRAAKELATVDHLRLLYVVFLSVIAPLSCKNDMGPAFIKDVDDVLRYAGLYEHFDNYSSLVLADIVSKKELSLLGCAEVVVAFIEKTWLNQVSVESLCNV